VIAACMVLLQFDKARLLPLLGNLHERTDAHRATGRGGWLVLANRHSKRSILPELDLLKDVDPVAFANRHDRLLHGPGVALDAASPTADHARLRLRLDVDRVHREHRHVEGVLDCGLDLNLGRVRMNLKCVFVLLREQGVLLRDHGTTENVLESQLWHDYATSSATSDAAARRWGFRSLGCRCSSGSAQRPPIAAL